MKTWIALAALEFVACAALPTSTLAQEPPALAAIKDPAEKTRVQKLIEGAKKEGVLSWIGVQFEPARARPIIAEFKRYYGLDNLQVVPTQDCVQ